jgi:hypothetical protein
MYAKSDNRFADCRSTVSSGALYYDALKVFACTAQSWSAYE